MLRKMSWADCVGVAVALLLIPVIALAWLVGWLPVMTMVIATVAMLLAVFLLFWVAARADDDDTNDTPKAVAGEMATEAQRGWNAVLVKLRSSDDK